jgi:uncharacterized protein (TIGR03435 family)
LDMRRMAQVAALAGWVAMGVFLVPAIAQDAGPQQPPKPSMMAKDADPDWEVVTVRPSDPNSMYGGYQIDGRDVMVRRKTVQSMLLFGYGVHRSQLMNLPDWTRTELWDARGHADVPGQPDREQLRSLVCKLMAERFGLTMHRERKEMDAYALTVAKGGAKMTPSAADPNRMGSENDRENNGQMTMHAENTSMGDLAGLLMRLTLDRPAVDRTGLPGKYDFNLTWTGDETRVTAADASPGLFTAIQEQMGLKLEPTKATVDVLVIDKVERPGAN